MSCGDRCGRTAKPLMATAADRPRASGVAGEVDGSGGGVARGASAVFPSGPIVSFVPVPFPGAGAAAGAVACAEPPSRPAQKPAIRKSVSRRISASSQARSLGLKLPSAILSRMADSEKRPAYCSISMNPDLHAAFLAKATGLVQRNTRNGRRPAALDHVYRAAVCARVSLLARRRQRTGQILMAIPALHPKRARSGRWLHRWPDRYFKPADFVRRDLAVGFLPSMCWGSVIGLVGSNSRRLVRKSKSCAARLRRDWNRRLQNYHTIGGIGRRPSLFFPDARRAAPLHARNGIGWPVRPFALKLRGSRWPPFDFST